MIDLDLDLDFLRQENPMGQDVAPREYTREDRRRYREAVRRCLDALERMLDERAFVDTEWTTGIEIETVLVDPEGRPAMVNTEVLEHLDSPLWTTELGRWTVELNVDPRRVDGNALPELEAGIRRTINQASDRAGDLGAAVALIGILPTLPTPPEDHDWFTDEPRYRMLDTAVFEHRREDQHIDISGLERLRMTSSTIIPEAACTSMQLHVQVKPKDFARYWNAAQVLAGPQLALGANSPFLFGKALQAETRIELFTQSTDTRPPELAVQGVKPLVPFGDSWVTSIFDLFEDNVAHYPALLPEISDEDPFEVLAAGRVPELEELRLHNGTVYRWNRPVYDTVDGRPHLRVENRVLPAGPTVADMMANAAFFYGVIVEMVQDERPPWTRMPFAQAEENFRRAAKHGVRTRLFWPKLGEIAATKLTLDVLLPQAEAGLARLGVDDAAARRYLEIIEGRARTRRNGATWQVDAVRSYERDGLEREEALRRMFLDYVKLSRTNEPVHTWDPRV